MILFDIGCMPFLSVFAIVAMLPALTEAYRQRKPS